MKYSPFRYGIVSMRSCRMPHTRKEQIRPAVQKRSIRRTSPLVRSPGLMGSSPSPRAEASGLGLMAAKLRIEPLLPLPIGRETTGMGAAGEKEEEEGGLLPAKSSSTSCEE